MTMQLPMDVSQMAAFSRLHHNLRTGASLSESPFEEYQRGDNFTVWLYKTDPRIEYVELTGASKPHCHERQNSAFWFLTPATLVLGGSGVKGPRATVVAYLTRYAAEIGTPYLVPPYVFHAVEPLPDQIRARFFIFNSAHRPRTSSEYTDDSIFPDHCVYR